MGRDYTYENAGGTPKRPLVTKIAYSSPNTTTIADPEDVTFAYDNVGKRTSMADGTGVLTYTYDELSRLTTETKDFADSFPLANTPGSSGVYALTYEYQLTGGLKSMTDPFGYQTTYSTDKIGRMTAIGDGTTTTAYASGISYRAFGAVKSITLGQTAPIDLSMTYDNALRPEGFQAGPNVAPIRKANYSYASDGLVKGITNHVDHNFDQKNEYDFASRLKVNDVGQPTQTHPLTQTFGYDAFDNLAKRDTTTYSFPSRGFVATYVNNKNPSWHTYDAAGNLVTGITPTPPDRLDWNFDAAGRQWRWEEEGPVSSATKRAGESGFDGDGRVVENVEQEKNYYLDPDWRAMDHRYFIYSSVTGEKITELWLDGTFYSSHVYLGDTKIADTDHQVTYFTITDPITSSTQGPESVQPEGDGRIELAGLHTYVPHIAPAYFPIPDYGAGASSGNPEDGCEFDGDPTPCNMIAMLENQKQKRKKGKKKGDPPKETPKLSALWSPSLKWEPSSSLGDDPPSGDDPCPTGQVRMLVEGRMQCVGAEPSEVEISAQPTPAPTPTVYNGAFKSYLAENPYGDYVDYWEKDPPYAVTHTCSQIGVGFVNIGIIEDGTGRGLQPTLGLGINWPPQMNAYIPNYAVTRGSGLVRPGVYLNLNTSNGLAISTSLGLDGVSVESGHGSPNVGIGLQFVGGRLPGSTEQDSRRNPHRTGTGGNRFGPGRCAF